MIGTLMQELFLRQDNAPLGAAASIVMMFIIAGSRGAVPLGRWLFQNARTEPLAMSKAPRALFIYAIGFMIFLYGPVLLMPVFSLNDSTFATFPLKGFTTRHYGDMLANTSMMLSLKNSLVVGTLVSVTATAIGLPASIALTRYRLPGGGPMLSAMMLPLVIPSIVISVALLVIILRFLHIDLSLWTVGAGPHSPLHSVFDDRADVAARRLRQKPRGGLARSRRERLDDLRARNASARHAGRDLKPAALLHHFLR